MVALLIEAGENLSAIQKRAGHSSHQITSDIYGHVTEKLENETVEYFNQFNPKNIGIDHWKKGLPTIRQQLIILVEFL